jgi:hypothetical protein
MILRMASSGRRFKPPSPCSPAWLRHKPGQFPPYQLSAEPVEISARPIMQFQIGHADKQFGPLEFVGGLELTSPSRACSAPFPPSGS